MEKLLNNDTQKLMFAKDITLEQNKNPVVMLCNGFLRRFKPKEDLHKITLRKVPDQTGVYEEI